MYLFLTDTPKIERGSKCCVYGQLLICVCISHGVPLPVISWPTTFTSQHHNITTSVVNDTVTSTITTSAALHNGTNTVLCLSINRLGQTSRSLMIDFAERGEDGKRLHGV